MATPLHLLLLEDNPSDAELMMHALRQAGFDPIGDRVETEAEFREQLRRPLQVILADFTLPEFDSFRALEVMRECRVDTPFIIVSGTIGEDRAVQAIQRGATDYIIKDRLGRLGPAVTQALEQNRLREAKRRAEQSLCESEELMRNAFDYANIAMVVAELNGHIVRANNAFIEMFGHSPAEVLNLSMSALTHPDDLAESSQSLNALLVGEVRYVQIEKRYLHKDGHVLWGLANFSLIHDVRGNPLLIVGQLQDVSERVAAEQALGESQEKRLLLEEQFRQSQKMEAVGQLAAGVAHDFNNLLTVIVGYSEILLENLPPSDTGREPIGEIHRAGQKAAALTRQLLAFSRKQILSPVVVDLSVLMAELEKMLRSVIGADIEVVTILQPGLGCVKVDPGQVEQIVMNLVLNACDAMATGGRLTIQTINTLLSDLQIQQNPELPPGPYTLLVVTDTGCGMDRATKARMFEPFFTTKEVGKGTGLGLASVFGIVKQSGGFLEVDSAPGMGSTFRIYFPRVLEEARRQESDTSPVNSPKKGGETILLVEDEDSLRKLTRLVLETSGYKVLSTRHGGEALQVCHEYTGDIQLLFTDVVMPSMSGRQLADLLAPLRPGMKVLYMSGYTDDTMVRHGVENEAANFLAKPFTPTRLAEKVREVLDGKNGMEESEAAGNRAREASPAGVS